MTWNSLVKTELQVLLQAKMVSELIFVVIMAELNLN
jgi:hypothetical protein